ncbi:MAG: sigma-70 family RNA polymerase sigma factor [Minisyncoccia bacterium]
MDSQEFSKIYDTYVEKIYRFVYLRINSKEEAQDITSQVFLNFLSKSNKITKLNTEDVVSLQAFLYRIAKNLVIDTYRKKGQVTFSLDDENIDNKIPVVNTTDDKLDDNNYLELIREKLNRLRSPYWEVVVWHYLEELDLDTIAKILNKTPGNTRVILHRGLNQLKKGVENEK